MQATAVILAAGLGTRMKSVLPKTLHRVAGRSMLRHLLSSCEQVFDRIVVVVGPDMHAGQREAAPHATVVQQERLGTAHAALAAGEKFGDGEVAILYADNPLIRPETLRRLLEARMGKPGKREFVQVLRLMEVFKIDDVAAAVRDAIARGAVGFDAVKHLVLCRIERRPPRLDMTIYPYLPKATVATTSARSYMDLLSGAAA